MRSCQYRRSKCATDGTHPAVEGPEVDPVPFKDLFARLGTVVVDPPRAVGRSVLVKREGRPVTVPGADRGGGDRGEANGQGQQAFQRKDGHNDGQTWWDVKKSVIGETPGKKERTSGRGTRQADRGRSLSTLTSFKRDVRPSPAISVAPTRDLVFSSSWRPRRIVLVLSLVSSLFPAEPSFPEVQKKIAMMGCPGPSLGVC